MLMRLISRLTGASTTERIGQHYGELDVLRREEWANCFGVESRGRGQVRGNGPLLLTRDALHFFLLIPRNEIRIPLADIVQTGIVSSHLGKTVGRPLLRVDYTVGEARDAAAWWVADPEGWRQRIDELR